MQRIKNTFLLIVTSKQKELITLLVLLILSFNSFTQTASSIPHLEIKSNKTQLIVNDKPFLILGGELGNSAASSRENMQPIWPKLREMDLNTVLMPVYWELIEPEENKFDFSLVDGLIADASSNNLHLVLLWFGTWKNSMSCYVPAWIKKLTPAILNSEPSKLNGVLLDKKNTVDTLSFCKYLFKISHDNTLGWNGNKNDSLWDAVGAIIIQTNEDEFWVGGSGVVQEFFL